MYNTFEFAGVKIHKTSLANAIKQIEDFIRSDKKSQVCVTNVYSVVMMQKDEKFKEANNLSSLSVADSMPIIWVSRLFSESLPERIAGMDLFYEFCKVASRENYKFFFLGSTEDTLNKMCLSLKKQFPKLQIVGTYSPPYKENFSDKENLEIIEKVNKKNPDIVWVGMTCPKQEKWIYQNLKKLNVKVAIGIGAVFDFVAGNVKRAPKWMQKIGLEWFWRLIREPKRLWKRYLIGNTIFIWLVLKELFRKVFDSDTNTI